MKGTEGRPDTEKERKQEEKDKNVKDKRNRDASDSKSEDMCMIKVLAPQPNTDTISHSEEMVTEDKDKVPVQIEKIIQEPEIERDLQLRKSTRKKKRSVWHDSYVMSQIEVSRANERVRLMTQLISSDVLKVASPTLIQKVVRSIVE